MIMAVRREKRAGKRVAVALCAAMALSSPALAEELIPEAELEDVVVTSTTIDDRFESKRQEPSKIDVISGKQVDEAHAENILQIINSIPGVTGELQSGDSLKIMLRGVENQRFMGEKPGVAIVIDGVPVFERTGRVNIDLDNIQSIKVIKGGASYLFGEDALAGAVVITTKRGAKMAGIKLESEFGSFDYRKLLGRVGYANDKFSAHIQASSRESDTYYFDGQYDARYVNGKFTYYLTENSDISFGFEQSNRTKDSHGTVTGVSAAKLDPESKEGRDYARMYDAQLEKLNLTYNVNSKTFGDLLLSVYQFTDHTKYVYSPQRYSSTGAAVTDPNAYTTSTDYEQTQQGFKGEWRKGSKKVAGMLGLDLRYNTYENFDKYIVNFRTRPAPPTYTAGTIYKNNEIVEEMRAIYGEVKYTPWKPLTITGNLRADIIALDYHNNISGQQFDRDKTFRVWSWRGGANYAVASNWDIYANVSTGFRVPTADQLYAGTISPTGGVANNSELKPEKAYNYELGFRTKGKAWGVGYEVDATVFQIDRDDFILMSAGQYSTATVAPGNEQWQNVGGTRNRGLELSIKTDPKRMVSADVAYSYMDAEFTKYDNFYLILGPRGSQTATHFDLSGNDIPRVPEHRLFVAARVKPMAGLTLTAEADTRSPYFADEMNLVKIDGYTTVNLLANYEWKRTDKNTWSFFVRADNVFNKDYYTTARGYYDSDGDRDFDNEDISIVMDPGTVWTAGITVTF
ncbi:MAG: TonB-dependent receptor [Nitrospirota bacterium]|nr:TonB-dependent receptor [Nitrospirota bacterium]